MSALALDVMRACAADRTHGDVLLCLHSSTGSGRQWRSLQQRMHTQICVRAPDLLGYGMNPPWPAAARTSLTAEIERLAPELPHADGVHLVGHSYGGAVALELALRLGVRARSVVLYEPTVMHLLQGSLKHASLAAELGRVASDVDEHVQGGRLADAAQRFIDYWAQSATFDTLPEHTKRMIQQRITKVPADFGAIASGRHPSDYKDLRCPVLLACGTHSPAPVRRIIALLRELLPNAQVYQFSGAGHMGPLTHAQSFDALVEAFLHDQAAGAVTRAAVG